MSNTKSPGSAGSGRRRPIADETSSTIEDLAADEDERAAEELQADQDSAQSGASIDERDDDAGISEVAESETDDAHADDKNEGSRSGFMLMLGVAATILVLDQVTKIWAASELVDRDIDLFWTARFHLIRNFGSAFGLGSGLGRWLGILISGIVVAVIVYARSIRDRKTLVLLGGIVGGAVGNLIDRVFRAEDGFMSGGVIDFIDFQWWPVFNIADMAVVISAFALMLLSLREPE